MSAQAMGWALDQPDIPGRPKLVLVAIANHADHTDGYCWLKAETIAREASCTPRSVFRFIGALIRNGYLRRAPRRGPDGKQRANDYWILFNREEAVWDWKAGLEGQEIDDSDDENEPLEDADADAETHGLEPANPQDVVAVGPVEKHVLSHGPHDSPVPRPVENKPTLSHGPCDTGVSHKDTAEPSKTKPLEGGLGKSVPRRYAPPPPEPPQPVGSIVGPKAELIFVYENTPAYEAWAKLKGIQNGISHWHCATTKVVNGTTRYGWYFPSLFPPSSHDPPSGSPLMTAEDAEQFSKTG